MCGSLLLRSLPQLAGKGLSTEITRISQGYQVGIVGLEGVQNFR